LLVAAAATDAAAAAAAAAATPTKQLTVDNMPARQAKKLTEIMLKRAQNLIKLRLLRMRMLHAYKIMLHVS